jgi:hypothetical protein
VAEEPGPKNSYLKYFVAIIGKGKVVPVLFLNQVARLEGVLGSGGIVSRLLDLDTKWR